jgi:hypothetical protein
MSDARSRDAELYRAIGQRAARPAVGAPPDTYAIAEAAKLSGTTPAVLRVWSARYGWPSPRRTHSGYRRYTAAEIELIKEVRLLVTAGRDLRDIIVDGKPVLSGDQPAAARAHLEFGDLPAPRTGEGYDTRTRLIAGILQRHPGIVRWAILNRARLHPADREAAVDGILRLATEQLGNPGWLLEVMHAV